MHVVPGLKVSGSVIRSSQAGHLGCGAGAGQNAVGAEPVPHDVREPGDLLPAVRPCRAPVRRPGELADAGAAAHALEAEAGEQAAGARAVDERHHSLVEAAVMLGCEAVQLCPTACRRRQARRDAVRVRPPSRPRWPGPHAVLPNVFRGRRHRCCRPRAAAGGQGREEAGRVVAKLAVYPPDVMLHRARVKLCMVATVRVGGGRRPDAGSRGGSSSSSCGERCA